jgi:glycerophosphoryl diester phosphodiesterase
VSTIHPYLDVGTPIAFAHRGGAGIHPENTERAFRHALELGYTHIETDVHVTRDGVAVAFHDDRLDRVTDRRGRVADLTWREVEAARVNGTEPILRLEQLFEAFPEARINLDPKHDAAVEPLADTIRSTGSVARVMVGSFSDARIAAVRRRVGDDLAVSAGPRRTARLLAQSRGLRISAGWVHAAQVPARARGLPLVTRRFVEHLHARGIHVHVWTINEADEMRRLLDLGVDGIMTDETELLRSVLRARGEWPERPGDPPGARGAG